MSLQRINPSSIHQPMGYHHVVKDGSTAYVSGQVSRDKDGNTVGLVDPTAQAGQIFKNLEGTLGSEESDLRHLKQLTVYLTHKEDIAAYRSIRNKLIPDDALPASTLIICAGLADPDFRTEVEAITSIP